MVFVPVRIGLQDVDKKRKTLRQYDNQCRFLCRFRVVPRVALSSGCHRLSIDFEDMARASNPSMARGEGTSIQWRAGEQLLFGDALVAAGLVTAEHLDLALRHANATETSIGHALVHIGAITQRHLMFFLEAYDEAAPSPDRPLANLSPSSSTVGLMTEDDHHFLQRWDDQLSPTLKENYALVKALDPVPVCVACPMAQWYKLEKARPKPGIDHKPAETTKPPTLECFCTAFRGVMYNGGRAVTACDAFQDAADERNGKSDPDR